MKKSIYPKCILLVLLFSFGNISYAQLKEHFERGFVELNNGQKIDGFIKEDELAKMIYKIDFKTSPADKKAVVYDTSQIKSFNFGATEVFELLHFSVNNRKEKITEFVRLLIRGKASLYKGVYNSVDLFVVKKDDEYFVLQDDMLESGTMSTEVSHYYYKAYLSKVIEGFTPSKVNIDKIRFDEQEFIELISEYNSSFGAENKVMPIKKKPVHFIIATAGGMYKTRNANEFFIQGLYRTYFPKVSRSTSLNIGLNYFKYKSAETFGNGLFTWQKNYTSTLLSLPVQLQQNLLNKRIRPYIFAGLNLAYYKVIDEMGNSQIQKGFQNNFGIGILGGAGVEIDLYKGLLIKGEYRYEIFTHMILFGVGYNFLNHK